MWDPDLVARRTEVSVLKLAGYELIEQTGSAQEAIDLMYEYFQLTLRRLA